MASPIIINEKFLNTVIPADKLSQFNIGAGDEDFTSNRSTIPDLTRPLVGATNFNNGVLNADGSIKSMFPDPTAILGKIPEIGKWNASDVFHIPSDSPFQFGTQQSLTNTVDDDSFRVRLVSVLDMAQKSPGDITKVVFKITPTLSEDRTVEYSPVQPVHMPGSFQVYKTTSSRTFVIGASFVSRNVIDATENMKNLQILRSWTLPFFGTYSSSSSSTRAAKTSPLSAKKASTNAFTASLDQIKNGSDGTNLLGAPPEVLYLYGYSTNKNDNRDTNEVGYNINRIPVVITNLAIVYNDDVDYIPVADPIRSTVEPFPVKLTVTINVTETHSPIEYEKFSLQSFKSGTLKHF